tara:strand:- start:205 stop:375 length:171 start_codon:yes stop_codon:yes gene_type:complete
MIKKWFFIQAKTNNISKNNLYIFNPYLKDAKHCLDTINVINNTNYKLKDVKYYFTD